MDGLWHIGDRQSSAWSKRRRAWQPWLTGWFCLLFLFAALGAADRAMAAKPMNVTRLYQQALAEHKRGQDKAALKLLNKITRKYPGFKPAWALAGTIHYQNRHPERAARYFRKAGPESITPDNAFAYGGSMFEEGNYREAIKGFRQVKAGTREKAYADFYAGYAQYKLRRWTQAEASLRRARDRDLPANFRTDKRRLMKDIDQRRLAESKAGPRAQPPVNSFYYTPPPPSPTTMMAENPAPAAPAEAGKAAVVSEKKDAAPAKPVAKTGINYSVTPRVNYSLSETQSDYSGNNQQNDSTTTTEVGLGGNISYTFDVTQGNQSVLGLNLDYGQNSSSLHTTNFQLYSYDTNPDEILAKEDSSTSAENYSVITVNPTLSTPVGDSLLLDAEYQYKDTQYRGSADPNHVSVIGPKGSVNWSFSDTGATGLDFSMLTTIKNGAANGEQQATDTMFGLRLSNTISLVTLKGSYAMTQTDKPETATLAGFKSKQVIELNGSATFGDIATSVTATQTNWEPPPGTDVVGAKDVLKLAANVTVPFSFGVSLALDGSYTQLKSSYDTVESADVDANGQPVLVPVSIDSEEQSVGVTLKIAPVDWFFLSANYKITQKAYNASDSNLQPGVEKKYPTDVQSSGYALGLSKTF